MLESLRARLLLWYSLILLLLVAIYTAAVTSVYRQTLLDGVDNDLAGRADIIVDSVVPDPEGTFDLNFPPEFRERVFLEQPPGERAYAIWDAEGALVDQVGFAGDPPAMPPPGLLTRGSRRDLVVDAPGPSRILVGQSLAATDDAVRSLVLTVAGAGAGVLLLSLAGGWLLAGRALAPIARISRTASAMIDGDLTARIPVKDTDSELEQVARALNEAFDRMRTAADLQRQFTADASHEFRTPLATLRAEFEWALKRPRAAEEYRGAIEKATKSVSRMTEIADRLLLLVRSESGARGAREPLDLADVVAATLDLITPLADTQSVTLHADLHPAPVRGDRSLLLDACSNLVKNAVEYNRAGGEVFVRLVTEGPRAVLSVRDTGMGIDAADVPHVFERFYRADRSRNRHAGGAGLGLAIVKKVVEDHGGTVECHSTVGEGTEFVVRLPLA
ncbi:MAG: sensor histidine kinase [Vicinamibacterales bacterium]